MYNTDLAILPNAPVVITPYQNLSVVIAQIKENRQLTGKFSESKANA